MNLPFESYAHLDHESHILYGAAVWILEQIRKREDWREAYRLLPRDDRMLDDLCLHDVWHADFEYDLVYSIEYVLHNRNGVETDGAQCHRTLTSDALACRPPQSCIQSGK